MGDVGDFDIDINIDAIDGVVENINNIVTPSRKKEKILPLSAMSNPRVSNSKEYEEGITDHDITNTNQLSGKQQAKIKLEPSSPSRKQSNIKNNYNNKNNKKRKNNNDINVNTVRVEFPTECDILCGQSRVCASHTGNKRFQAVLDTYAARYDNTTSKQEKMMMTKEIVACIHNSSGRFLKYKNEDGIWEEISNVAARDKVSHALRTKVASWKKQKQQLLVQEIEDNSVSYGVCSSGGWRRNSMPDGRSHKKRNTGLSRRSSLSPVVFKQDVRRR